MKRSVLLGVSFVLLAVGGMYYAKLIPYEKGAFNVEELKEAERAQIHKGFEPNSRSGRVKEGFLREMQSSYLDLANQDVSEFFNKNIPLDQPNMPETYLLTWVALVVPDVMTFGFNDYKVRLGKASDYFTDKGWNSFFDAFERSRTIEIMETNQQIFTVAPKAAPGHNSRGVDKTRNLYRWVVQLPVAVTYRSRARSINTQMLVTVVIVRSDDPKHSYGIAIDQWIAESRR